MTSPPLFADPSPHPDRAADGPASRLVVVASVAVAALLGYVVTADPDFLHLDAPASPAGALALVFALGLLVLVLRRPDWGLPLLLVFVYANLSQVLVRHHGLPSLLPLFAVALFVRSRLRQDTPALARLLLRPMSALLAGYSALLVFSTTYARSWELADERVLENAKALAVYVLVAVLAPSLDVVRRGVWALLGAGALLATLALVQVVGGGFRAQYGGLARVKYAHIYGQVFEPRIAGPLGDPNFFAQILVVLVPLGLLMAWQARTPRGRALAYASAALVTAATVFTYSRGGALALGVVLGLSLLARRVRPGQAAAGAAVLALVWLGLPREFTRRLGTMEQILPGGAEVIHPDASFEKRKLLTQVAWKLFLDHPLLGVGAGNYTAYFDEYADLVGSVSREYEEPEERHYPHSLYLEIAAETGLPGLAVWSAAVIAAFLALRRARVRFLDGGQAAPAELARAFGIALVGYLVGGLFLHGHFPRYLWMLFGFASAIEGLSARAARQDRGQERA